MIDFNQKDDNLPQIKQFGKFDFYTQGHYRVYGLKQEKNPAILIEYNRDEIPTKKIKPYSDFFNKNKIKTCAVHVEKTKGKIYIGLRTDLRKNFELSKAVIETIILGLEGKLENFKKTRRFPNIPSFK